MNKEFLKKRMWEGKYILKQGTNTSYLLESYWSIERIEDRKAKADATLALIEQAQESGTPFLLPLRVCFVKDEFSAPVIHSGRGLRRRAAQMKSTFTKPEVSPYKIAKPYKVCTSVWQMQGLQCLYWGTIGITPAEGLAPIDNGDLAIFYTADWEQVRIFIFKGLAKPNDAANLNEAVAFVLSCVR